MKIIILKEVLLSKYKTIIVKIDCKMMSVVAKRMVLQEYGCTS